MHPNKLISMIKNPYGSSFDEVFLISNPLPCVIGYKNGNYLISYSLSGMIIKECKLDKIYDKILPIFNLYGGIFQDRIALLSEKNKDVFNAPLLTLYKSIRKEENIII